MVVALGLKLKPKQQSEQSGQSNNIVYEPLPGAAGSSVRKKAPPQLLRMSEKDAKNLLPRVT
eukprot:3739913-Amphidinium_carterae.1